MKSLNALVAAILVLIPLMGNATDLVIIHAGKLMSVPGESVKNKQSIVIQDGKIVDVKQGYISASSVQKEQSDSVIIHDLKNSFVMPEFMQLVMLFLLPVVMVNAMVIETKFLKLSTIQAHAMAQQIAAERCVIKLDVEPII